jgi:hypothetical protein
VRDFLLPETVVREDGAGPEIGLGASQGESLKLTLGITHIIEQESLDVSIWGSADKINWGVKPLVAFPPKFYCGTYLMLLDLSAHRDAPYLRVQWKVSRWGRGEPKPMFGFYVFAEPAAAAAAAGD